MMFKRSLIAAFYIVFTLGTVLDVGAQESGKGKDYIIVEDLDKEAIIHPETVTESRYITSEILTPEEVTAAINYYIHSDINRKFSGLITNLRLEKIYGILQEGKTASVYFDYSYTSIRNRDNVLFEKGKMTFMKFNSGKWFNAELSIFLMDSYPAVPMGEQNEKVE